MARSTAARRLTHLIAHPIKATTHSSRAVHSKSSSSSSSDADMGSGFSTANDIDGLGLKVPESYQLPRPSKESRTKLEQLLRANNATYGTLWNDKKFHNHMPHALISAYFLGASPNQLTYLYEAVSKSLVPWKEDSPQVVTDEDWKNFLGIRKYERGYFDYFSDKIADAKFEWRSVVNEFIDNGLKEGVFGGLTHAVIHLGYAFEVDSGLIAAEALTLATTNYLAYDLDSSKVETISDAAEVLNEIREDAAFNNLYKSPSESSVSSLVQKHKDKLSYYTARLEISDARETLKQLIHVGALAFLATHKDTQPAYSFFTLHLLTSSQELAEIIFNPTSNLSTEVELQLVTELWTSIVAIYITQMRPLIKPSRVTDIKIESVESAWHAAVTLVLNSPHEARTDEHYIKAVRALLFAELFLEDKDGFYARGAYKFAQVFAKNPHYAGFSASEQQLDIKQ